MPLLLSLPHNIKNQKGNFIVLVAFIAVSFVVFIHTFSQLASSYASSQESAKRSAYALTAAESVIERLPYEYNQLIHNSSSKTVKGEEYICIKHEVNIFGNNLSQGVYDFGAACQNETSHESIISKSATRMVNKEKTYLDRYQSFEYRMTENEFQELTENSETYPKPAKLKISWKSEPITESMPPIEIILASWPKSYSYEGVQIHRITPKEENTLQDNSYFYYELLDISEELETDNFPPVLNFEEKSYIVFIRSLDIPLDISIEGFSEKNESPLSEERQSNIQYAKNEITRLIQEGAIGEDINTAKEALRYIELKIPSRFIFFKTTAKIQNQQNPLNNYSRTVHAERQLYSDLDSSFPYSLYQIQVYQR